MAAITLDDVVIEQMETNQTLSELDSKTRVLVISQADGFQRMVGVGFPPLQKFAKELGRDVMESFGRPGWKKMWEGYGYNPRYVFYELPVE